ncbi:hypothetical protein [Solirubrobacter soli]|uniref:hypothetical protein n=1 Tax=Solirubrobacter soli TaxID=363832 RepID=UPI0003F5F834|nr:hypothetical protein [Solirubrobacter soli]
MTDELLDRMRALDPARDTDLTPPDELLSALLADFPEPRRRRRFMLALPAGALAAAAAAVIAFTGGSTPDLAAQAYAQTSQARDILYVRARVVSQFGSDRLEMTRENWLYRDRARRHDDVGAKGWSDMVLRPDGSVRFRNRDGQDVVSTDADGPDAQSWHQQLQQNFVAEFRRNYQKGTLDPAGTAEFAGRRAQVYVVDTSGVAPAVPRFKIREGTWTDHREFFIDADDGTPLGSIQESTTKTPGQPAMTSRVVETVEAIEHLEPTPENLAKLSR